MSISGTANREREESVENDDEEEEEESVLLSTVANLRRAVKRAIADSPVRVLASALYLSLSLQSSVFFRRFEKLYGL